LVALLVGWFVGGSGGGTERFAAHVQRLAIASERRVYTTGGLGSGARDVAVDDHRVRIVAGEQGRRQRRVAVARGHHSGEDDGRHREHGGQQTVKSYAKIHRIIFIIMNCCGFVAESDLVRDCA